MNAAAAIFIGSPPHFSISIITAYPQQKIFPRNTMRTQNSSIYNPRKNKNSRTEVRKSLSEFENNISVARKLSEHLEAGCYENALEVFENMRNRNRFIWNVFIRCLTDSKFFREAIYFYHRMQSDGIGADYYTFPFVLKACGAVVYLAEGEKIHARVIKMGLDVDLYICNSLITMYSKLGCIELSENIFRSMPVKDLVSWNSMISGYVSSGRSLSALICFREMQDLRDLSLDRFSMISVLGACSSLDGSLMHGKEIHCQVIKRVMNLDSMIETSLVDMYGKNSLLGYSERVFSMVSRRNIAVWNAMIGAYTSNDEPLESLSCFRMMQEGDDLAPDVVTLINFLPSCARIRAFSECKSIHGFAFRRGILPHVVFETALVDMYGKRGRIKEAESIFLGMEEKNLISLNAIISAYVHNGFQEKAVELFLGMSDDYMQPDEFTFVNLLSVCGEIAFPKEGKQFHCYIVKLGFGSNTFICNSLIYMYAKCGDIQAAEKVFNRTVFVNLISWNSIIMAFGIHGFGRTSIRLFLDMVREGINPSPSTFVSLLTSCSISGLLDEGQDFFNSMRTEYKMDPGIEHYGCIIDLVGRSGDLELAKLIIDEMPLTPTSRIWGSLLTASRCHGNIGLAELASDHILSEEYDNTGCYVLLSNMYAGLGRWSDAERVKCSMEDQGLRKTVGLSKVEGYQFKDHDRSHPEASMIYEALHIASEKRYVLNKFRPMDEVKKKAKSTSYHSVRLAVCFGLISTSVGSPVLVRKNVRICEECHNAVKKMSEITNREILVGDSKMYHHFKNGECSCKDYW